ncbi:MAG TPA: hypothetical protein VLJ58_11255 [Ramlibacter sp.]|nr:hypothetical protein [Ramlibacter sp.]
MRKQILAAALAMSALAWCLPVRAHNEASALSAVSALPLASVVVGASAVAAVPVLLSAGGTVLVVKAVEVSARGTVYLLERASDGARVSVEIAAGAAGQLSLAAGTVLAVTVVGSGVILSAAGEAIAFVPNALGRALLHNERLTN